MNSLPLLRVIGALTSPKRTACDCVNWHGKLPDTPSSRTYLPIRAKIDHRPMPLAAGTRLGNYDILGPLGQFGCGAGNELI